MLMPELVNHLMTHSDDDALVTAANASTFSVHMMQPYVVQHNKSIATLEGRSQVGASNLVWLRDYKAPVV